MGAQEGVEKPDTPAVISPAANSSEFRKLSVTQQFGSRLERPHGPAAPRSEAGEGEGRVAEFAQGQRRPGPAASAFEPGGVRRALPSHDFISPHPPRSGRGCRVPAVRPGALRWETHLDPAPVAAGR